MQDQIGIPNCFSSTGDNSPENLAAITKSGQSVFTSIYRTKIISHCRFITVTWCKNLLLHGLSISIERPGGGAPYTCKLEVKSWKFWRKQGSKRLLIDDDKAVDVFWDLRAARFNGDAEPNSEYYVAIVCDEEVILHLGNLKTEAYRKTNCRPSLIDPILVCRKEHVFGKKRFSSKGKFHEKGKVHEIWIECRGGNNGELKTEPEMEIKIDGKCVIDVKHLEWKFRGNESITIGSRKVEVYWDVHDWLFSPGLRHALFIFRPVVTSPMVVSPPPSSSIMAGDLETVEGVVGEGGSLSGGSWEFCLFLYAWRVE
ncbi:uncharacterized protein LOC124916319 [Impatiens glandulifera]|uniref:uncharacterized protein LOC124916319 n=1 Tax=Impatiens glandulifera TaxID=253017 RepID=UPI001FB0B1D1|nr:uncharacterized protein LOC124916319 [Impatiens glandulifera]